MFGIIKVKIINKGRAGGIRKYIEITDKDKIRKALEDTMNLGFEEQW